MNIFFPPNQELLFLYSFLCGIALGIVYDVFAVKRSLTVSCWWILLIDDTLFSLAFLLLFEAVVFTFNDGRVRGYELLFTLLGFVCYKITLSRIVMFVFDKISRMLKFTLKKIIGYILRVIFLILLPLKFPLKLLNKYITKIYMRSYRTCAAYKITNTVRRDLNKFRM